MDKIGYIVAIFLYKKVGKLLDIPLKHSDDSRNIFIFKVKKGKLGPFLNSFFREILEQRKISWKMYVR